MFDDDYTADNRIQFNGKFLGRTNVKFNAYATPKLANNEVTFGLQEDAQLDLKANGVGFQAKFKPSLISTHADFDHHLRTWVVNGQAYNFWFNPYLLWETNRSLKSNHIHFGILTQCDTYKNHVRFILSDKKKNHWLDIQNNWFYSYKGFSLNYLHTASIGDIVRVLNKKILFGYQTGAYSTVLTLLAN